MISRVSRWAVILAIVTGAAAPVLMLNSTGAGPAAAEELAELKEQLRFGLLVTRPEDQAYLDHVVELVEQERLPLDLVKGTFQWARRQKKRYPFLYFKQALKIRAAERGIILKDPPSSTVGQ